MSKLKVTFDDDGVAWVDTGSLEAQLGNQIRERETNLMNYLNQKDQEQNMKDGADQYKKTVESVVSKDERYTEADKIRTDALKFLDEEIREWQMDNRVGGTLNTAQALQVVEKLDLWDEFKDRYPDLDLVMVLGSLNSVSQLERALENIANTLPDPNEGTVEHTIETNTASDILEMGDDDIGKLLDQMAEDEKTNGWI